MRINRQHFCLVSSLRSKCRIEVSSAGARGKLVQALAYGAKIVKVRGSFDTALEMVEELVSNDKNFYLMNSINPFRVEGQKTAAYEIYEQLGRVPDYVVLPVGNA